MIMNKEQVLSFMPHRPPFLFIDSVSELIIPDDIRGTLIKNSRDLTGSRVIAHFYVDENLEILKGHFPGNPILPGVVQVEMMAQASAFVSLGLNGLDKDKVEVETLLLGVESSKFRKPVKPGMHLEVHSTMDKCRGLMAYYNCAVYCEGEKVSEAKLLARLDVKEKE